MLDTSEMNLREKLDVMLELWDEIKSDLRDQMDPNAYQNARSYQIAAVDKNLRRESSWTRAPWEQTVEHLVDALDHVYDEDEE